MGSFLRPKWPVLVHVATMLAPPTTVVYPVVMAAPAAATHTLRYEVASDWLKLPSGRPEPNRLGRRIGYMHGDVAVSSTGEVYVSVQNMWYVDPYLDGRRTNAGVGIDPGYRDPYAGLQIFPPDGTCLRDVPNAPSDLHGFLIRKEGAGEYLYGLRLAANNAPPDQTTADWYAQAVVKLTPGGRTVLSIPASAFPDKYVIRRKGVSIHDAFRADCAPNGDIYVSVSDYVHRFDRAGKYVTSFGGKQPTYSFNFATDRANGRVVHLSLEGDFYGVVAQDLRLRAAVAIWRDYAEVAELGGRITVLDKKPVRQWLFSAATTLKANQGSHD